MKEKKLLFFGSVLICYHFSDQAYNHLRANEALFGRAETCKTVDAHMETMQRLIYKRLRCSDPKWLRCICNIEPLNLYPSNFCGFRLKINDFPYTVAAFDVCQTNRSNFTENKEKHHTLQNEIMSAAALSHHLTLFGVKVDYDFTKDPNDIYD